MAIYHCSIKPVGRSSGRSSVSAVAYRSAECLKDDRTGEVHDYTKKRGVEYTELLLPENIKLTREKLWSMAELTEKRKDSRVAREIEIALPHELTLEQRKKLTLEYAQVLVNAYGVGVDVALHEPNKKGDQKNYHAHIMLTTRQITSQGLGNKSDLELEDKALRQQGKLTGREQITNLRETWGTLCNKALEQAGHDKQIDHKSLKAQGIKREPTIHVGVHATAMERRGIATERENLNKNIKELNEINYNIDKKQIIRAKYVEEFKNYPIEWQRKFYDDFKKQSIVRDLEKEILKNKEYDLQRTKTKEAISDTDYFKHIQSHIDREYKELKFYNVRQKYSMGKAFNENIEKLELAKAKEQIEHAKLEEIIKKLKNDLAPEIDKHNETALKAQYFLKEIEPIYLARQAEQEKAQELQRAKEPIKEKSQDKGRDR